MFDSGTTSQAALERAATVIKCLGHPLRLQILQALQDGEKTVSELQEISGAKQAAVSHQLAVLRSRDIVDCRRQGLNVFYWIVEDRVDAILTCIRTHGDGRS